MYGLHLLASVDDVSRVEHPKVATGSRLAWDNLGCGQHMLPTDLHPFQATNVTNDTEQLVAAAQSLTNATNFSYGSHLRNPTTSPTFAQASLRRPWPVFRFRREPPSSRP